MTLLGEIVRDGQIVCSDTALNDIVLTRLESMKMLRFSLYVNDQLSQDIMQMALLLQHRQALRHIVFLQEGQSYFRPQIYLCLRQSVLRH